MMTVEGMPTEDVTDFLASRTKGKSTGDLLDAGFDRYMEPKSDGDSLDPAHNVPDTDEDTADEGELPVATDAANASADAANIPANAPAGVPNRVPVATTTASNNPPAHAPAG